MILKLFVLQHCTTDRSGLQAELRVTEGALIVQALFWN